MDAAIVRWLNSGVGTLSWLDGFIKVVVNDYFVPVTLSLLLLGVWFGAKTPLSRELHQRAALTAMLGVAFGNLAVQIIGAFTFRDRPYISQPLELLFYQPTDSSFPANPAVVGAAIAAGLWGADRRLGSATFGVAALWGISRVYAGVSYPTDVLAGVAIGVGVVMGLTWVLRRIEPLPTMVIQLAQRFYLA